MAPLDDTYGALLIGVLVAGILYGFTCVQTWYYFSNYRSDAWRIKALVLAVLFLDSGHQVVITHVIYTYVITNFGSQSELGVLVWSVIGEVFFNAITTLLVQCFLTMRIWRLSNKNRFMTSSAVLFIIAEFVIAFAFSVKALHFSTFAELITLKPVSLTINAVAAAGDAVIALFLCYLLQKSRTGFQKSETMINKLIVFSINTGLLTSFCALASFISYNVWPKAYIYVAFYFCIGRLYCNSLLATLNARRGLGGETNNDMTLSLQGATNHTRLGTTSKRMPNNISIKIDTTHEYIRDEYSVPNADVKDPDVV